MAWSMVMRADEFEGKYYSPEDDKFQQAKMTDSHKPVLTLMHLNKLKKMRAAKDLEDLVHSDHLEIQYAAPEESQGI
jgi:hypothetical protein